MGKNWCGIGDGDCDPNNEADCAPGLVCGFNNCHKFHDTGLHTGIPDTGDCCELPKTARGQAAAAESKSKSDETGSGLVAVAQDQVDTESAQQAVANSAAKFSLLGSTV